MPGLKQEFSIPGFDGIFHLPKALKLWPDKPLILYVRESTDSQVEDGNLHRQWDECREWIAALGRKPIHTFGTREAEDGKLSSKRPNLLEAVALARKKDGILCCRDLIRLFHPAAYHQQTNPKAPYTVEDRVKLRQLVGPDVPLATILPPGLLVREVIRCTTKSRVRRTGAKGGRRPAVWGIRAELLRLDRAEGATIEELMKRYRVGRNAVYRCLERGRDEPEG
jgi:resolvase-like protein